MISQLEKVKNRVADRSARLRSDYEDRMKEAWDAGPSRTSLSCGNLAHGFAACSSSDKDALKKPVPNIAIVSAYNDMLSAHQPFERFPRIIKEAVAEKGAVAQFAGGVPAMCDGVTQGQPGMELSLFSRDTIALSTAVALSHNMFDGAICLGVCDKIVPGMLVGALSFGHLPTIFLPAGPMETGLPNKEKARVRELFAKGEVGRDELLEAESKSYHSPGTCTFYGTANTNQMLMEFMGLHLPGSSFVNPSDPLRDALTKFGSQLITERGPSANIQRPLYEIVTVEAILNGIVGLLATGGSTNLTIHLIAMARAAGIVIDWNDMAELSSVVPLLTRVYPNGSADVNQFHAAGGLPLTIKELLRRGLLFNDVKTVIGEGLDAYTKDPKLGSDGEVHWQDGPDGTLDSEIIKTHGEQFQAQGGLQLLTGNLGRAITKVSAVEPQYRKLTAPARVFCSQEAVLDAYKAGELHKDVIIVLKMQGPKANGMPELHKLTPALGVLQGLGHKVALVTDGRMSGASGKVPAAIHLTPEAIEGGPIGLINDDDMVVFDAEKGTLLVEAELTTERARVQNLPQQGHGVGRELFASFRKNVSGAEKGASSLFDEGSLS
ncbi:MAG: phosphogluconate dehydratase [Pseudobacteriovorax sp.]|nr:phosphogluconate dehydratase [Pseudobacteriovorax sp.]